MEYGANVQYTSIKMFESLDAYDRLMKLCNYYLPFFAKRPNSDKVKELVSCFIEVEDILVHENFWKFETRWGYKVNTSDGYDYGRFPSLRFSDKLGFFIIYSSNSKKPTAKMFKEIKKEFEEGKNRLDFYKIDYKSVNLVTDMQYFSPYQFIIEIFF